MNRPLVRFGESSLQLVLLLAFRRWELVIAMAWGSVRGLEELRARIRENIELSRAHETARCRGGLRIMACRASLGKV